MKDRLKPAGDFRVLRRSAQWQLRHHQNLKAGRVQVGTAAPVDRRCPGLEVLQQCLRVLDGTDAVKKYRVSGTPDGHQINSLRSSTSSTRPSPRSAVAAYPEIFASMPSSGFRITSMPSPKADIPSPTVCPLTRTTRTAISSPTAGLGISA